MLWGPGFVLTSENVTANHPIENVPQIWNLIYQDSEYVQLVMEFENGVIVADAPPHQSLFTIDWVEKTLKKPITHLWVSVSSDGSRINANCFDIAISLSQGPHWWCFRLCTHWSKANHSEIAVDYWSSIPNSSFVTYT
jgi:hypothetical protein